jgi:NAD(P)-dependent dehydrogenase (short-subunit alcohol dehydrogenase family)
LNRVNQHFDESHVVLITGGGTGIGFEIAKEFDRRGATVIIAGRRKEPLENAARKLSPRTLAAPFDLKDTGAADSWIESLISRTGLIKTLVNNAGQHQKKETLLVEDEELLAILTTNLRGSFALSKAVAKRLMEHGADGDIQFISSMAAIFGIPQVAAYTASKSAVSGLVRQLAVEWGDKGIRVNAIAPGFIDTAMSRSAFENDPARKQKVLSRTPLARLGNPAEIAGVSAFLSSGAASFITGVMLPVDGGASIGF